jgi:citrate lyase subunit beta/citryl-CoA lyase
MSTASEQPGERPLLPPNRSYLFVPGSSQRRLEKCLDLGSDAIIVDLEDAVAPSDKGRARELLAAWLDGPAATSETPVYVRVNPTVDSVDPDDLEVACHARVAGLFIPKTELASVLAAVARDLVVAEQRKGIGPLVLIPVLETAAGVLDLRTLVNGITRVAAVTLGIVDLMADVRAVGPATGPLLEAAQGLVVLASRAAGLSAPIDTVSPDITDLDSFVAATRRAKALGHWGKMVIHPSQIEPANRIFTPTAEEVASAERILAAFAASVTAGEGALRFEGHLIDKASVRAAEEIVAVARRFST